MKIYQAKGASSDTSSTDVESVKGENESDDSDETTDTSSSDVESENDEN